MMEDFDSLMADILPGNVTSYPDFESAEKARKELDALPASHCAIFSRTEKIFIEVPIKAAVMVCSHTFNSFLEICPPRHVCDLYFLISL